MSLWFYKHLINKNIIILWDFPFAFARGQTLLKKKTQHFRTVIAWMSRKLLGNGYIEFISFISYTHLQILQNTEMWYSFDGLQISFSILGDSSTPTINPILVAVWSTPILYPKIISLNTQASLLFTYFLLSDCWIVGDWPPD